MAYVSMWPERTNRVDECSDQTGSISLQRALRMNARYNEAFIIGSRRLGRLLALPRLGTTALACRARVGRVRHASPGVVGTAHGLPALVHADKGTVQRSRVAASEAEAVPLLRDGGWRQGYECGQQR
jgi:hypothetical protein